jgi:hypothetical protein
MSSKKIENILNLIEIAENNLKNAKALLQQSLGDSTHYTSTPTSSSAPSLRSTEEDKALEVVEGFFNGESMIGDNGQTYIVPPNYASKTQLVVGDRLKWILTNEREVYKLIQPVDRDRVKGTFSIEGDSYIVLVDAYPNPIKILKASATYAMKNLGLKIGDEVAILIPKDATPTWGAFSSVVRTAEENKDAESPRGEASTSELENVTKEFSLDNFSVDSDKDYF